MRFLSLLIAFYLGCVVLSHPTYYDVDRNLSCVEPQPAKIYSWHIHILYNHNDPKHMKGAMDIFDNF